MEQQLTGRDLHVIECIVLDTKQYSRDFKCNLLEAFKDVISDGPVLTHLAKTAALQLGLEIPQDWLHRHTELDRDTVNQYYQEQYEN